MGLDGQLPDAIAFADPFFLFEKIFFVLSTFHWFVGSWVWHDKSLGNQQHPELNARRVTLILLASLGASSS